MSLSRVKRLRSKICHAAKTRWHYEGDDHLYVDFILAVIAAHNWRDNPPWAVIIGPPGSGKTDFLMCMQGHDDVKSVGKLTAKSLVSGWAGKDQSLLPLLDEKFLILKDFTTMLQMDPRTRDDVIGQLRGAYDGHEGGGFGIGGEESGIKEYDSHFTTIAACTPIYEHYYSVNQQLGERFTLLKFRHVDPEKSARKALENQARGRTRRPIQILVHAYIEAVKACIPAASSMRFPQKYTDEIIQLAALVARARTHVHRDGRAKGVQSKVVIETPTRLSLQFSKIAMGSAVSYGRTHITNTDMTLVRRCAGDSVPSLRFDLMRALYNRKRARMVNFPDVPHMHGADSKHIARTQHVSRTTAARHLEDLYLCGILKEHREDGRNASPVYALADEHYKLLKKTKVHHSGIKNVWQSNGQSNTKKKK